MTDILSPAVAAPTVASREENMAQPQPASLPAAFPGRMAPFDLSRARDVLHFNAEILWDTEELDFDPARARAAADG